MLNLIPMAKRSATPSTPPAPFPHSSPRGRRAIGWENLNIGDLARKADVSYTNTCEILSGKRMPSVPSAQKLAEAMGLRVDEFLKLIAKMRSKVGKVSRGESLCN